MSPKRSSDGLVDTTTAAVNALIALSEEDLQRRVICPLLAALGFDNIRDHSGPRERGSDLVATKLNEFNRLELFSIQIKRWKPDAKAASSRSLGHLINQLGQALKEKVVNPLTLKPERPHRCLFFTPFAVPSRAHEDFNARLQDVVNAGAELVDGPALVRLLIERSPATLAAFSMDLQYRLRLSRQVTRVAEARVAFDGNQDLDLERIYVDVALVEDPIVEHFGRYPRATDTIGKTSKRELSDLKRHVASVLTAIGDETDVAISRNDR